MKDNNTLYRQMARYMTEHFEELKELETIQELTQVLKDEFHRPSLNNATVHSIFQGVKGAIDVLRR